MVLVDISSMLVKKDNKTITESLNFYKQCMSFLFPWTMTEFTRKILIVEDDPDISQLLGLHLEDMGHQVTRQSDGAAALPDALSDKYDLILLDLVLPGIDGVVICKRLRAAEIKTPILMLTSKSSICDRVRGLEAGADDYLTKPFNVRELRARVMAMLRRSALQPDLEIKPKAEILQRSDLRIDLFKRTALIGRKELSLTLKEFDLLVQFAKHPGRVYSRNELLDLVWGYNYQGYEHTVNSHINRLRGKIESDPSRPNFILTVHKLGYKFADVD